MKSNTISVLVNASMTGTTVVNSNPIPLDQIYGFALQAYWTGTPVGTFKLQGSCDAPGKTTQTSNGGPDIVTNWSDIANSTTTAAGSSGNFVWNFNGCFFRYVRLVYTNASGTGTLNAEIVNKG